MLNRKTFEAALPHMPMATVMAMVAADVAGHPPLHERAEGSVGGRLHDQVEMIRHEADAEERDGVFGFRRGEQVETCGVVPVLVEDHGAAVATIQHMHGRRVRLLVREESEAWDAYGTRNGSREARKSSLSPFPIFVIEGRKGHKNSSLEIPAINLEDEIREDMQGPNGNVSWACRK